MRSKSQEKEKDQRGYERSEKRILVLVVVVYGLSPMNIRHSTTVRGLLGLFRAEEEEEEEEEEKPVCPTSKICLTDCSQRARYSWNTKHHHLKKENLSSNLSKIGWCLPVLLFGRSSSSSFLFSPLMEAKRH